jgi:pimeloyl-ACP methyl ester carboxylesterase
VSNSQPAKPSPLRHNDWVRDVLECLLMVSFAGLLSAQDPERGKIADKVICSGNGDVSYALYLPSNYSGDRALPILYCMDPLARGGVPVERFAKAAEAEGFVVVGSNNSRNGPITPVREAISAMVADTRERFHLEPKRTYVAGFSGGSRVALSWAMNGQVAGVIACGAAFGPTTPKGARFYVYEAAGVDDFNYHELHQMSLELARAGAPNRFSEFQAGHEWLPEDLALDALQFFNGKVPARPAVESKQEKNEFVGYEHWKFDLAEADAVKRAAMIKDLRKSADRTNDNQERRVARRVLAGTFIGSVEAARQFAEDKQYDAAVRAWETAALVRPDEPGVWYSLAVASAAAGDRKKALRSLEEAASKGFSDWPKADAEPSLTAIRTDKRYKALAGK